MIPLATATDVPSMNLLYPKITWPQMRSMIGMAGVGALVAGLYGIVHDEVTYTIAPEYFTRLKFAQFAWANFGLPPRLRVAEIGFLATCWVGFFGVWFLARLMVSTRWSADIVRRHIVMGMLLMLAGALCGAVTGGLLTLEFLAYLGLDYSQMAAECGVKDVAAFTHVACIHSGSYLGGLACWALAVILILSVRPHRRLA
jgi:hypothetical protein